MNDRTFCHECGSPRVGPAATGAPICLTCGARFEPGIAAALAAAGWWIRGLIALILRRQ